jgi:DNA-binding XRE family transcriptional regulator
MKRTKVARLKKAGWKVGSVRELLALDEGEAALIEMKLALADCLRDLRMAKEMTQLELANKLGSSQSRVAKMEAADVTVSLELLVRALLQLGATNRQIGSVIGKSPKKPAA